jgi:hypothetical protein
MTQTSRWATGTYELVLDFSGTDPDNDIIATVFAMPADNTPEADEDAPILAQAGFIIPELGELKGVFAEGKNAIVPVGENGLAPEDMEAMFGPKTAVRILLLLFKAAEADFNGVDMDKAPWRTPSTEAFSIMERTHDVMTILGTRLYKM